MHLVDEASSLRYRLLWATGVAPVLAELDLGGAREQKLAECFGGHRAEWLPVLCVEYDLHALVRCLHFYCDVVQSGPSASADEIAPWTWSGALLADGSVAARDRHEFEACDRCAFSAAER